MANDQLYQNALKQLQQTFLAYRAKGYFEKHSDQRDQVLELYGEIFSEDNLQELNEEEFKSFLLFKNNFHWDGIHRYGGIMSEDMDTLRKTLQYLLYGKDPISSRFTRALNQVRGLGKATATPMLLVTHPDQFGVWNAVSEQGLKYLDLWPDIEPGTSPGEKYTEINSTLNRLAEDLEIDLWTLDTLWWMLLDEDQDGADAEISATTIPEQRFGLERHLHDFLRDNWDRTSLGEDWELYREPEDEDAGYEYPTGVGRIDLLAKHRKKKEWLVVELKRDQTNDETVGQVLRYIGWVRRHLSKKEERVRGLIIARDPKEPLLYALDAFPGREIELQRYEVEFELFPVGLEID